MSSGPACPPRASCAGRTALRLRHRPQDVRPPACSASSPASGAMGCGNSTATSAGAGRGESDGRPGARGRRRGESGEVCRAGRLSERGDGRGGGKEGCRDPGREGVQPPLLVRISRTGAVRPLLKRPNAGHLPPSGGGHAWTRRACRAIQRRERGRTGGVSPLAGHPPGEELFPVVAPVRAPGSHTRSPRPRSQLLGTQTLPLESAAQQFRSFLVVVLGGCERN